MDLASLRGNFECRVDDTRITSNKKLIKFLRCNGYKVLTDTKELLCITWDEIDEDELFDEEKEKLEKGESLTPEGEEPPGITITRISQNPQDWQKWWSENKSRFSPEVRYRSGKPYSPLCLLENLQSEKNPRKIRQLAYEELVIRYNVDISFETDMFVARQKQALAKYAEWIQANGSQFQSGNWYFAGQMLNA